MTYETYSDSTGSIRWEGYTVFTNDDLTEWSSEPYNEEQRKFKNKCIKDELMADHIIDFIEKLGKNLKNEFDRINDGTSTLSKKYQKWFKEHFIPVSGRGRGTTIIGNY